MPAHKHYELLLPTSGSAINYRVVLGHRNWQIEIAVWNLAGFFTVGAETCWQQFGQFLHDELFSL